MTLDFLVPAFNQLGLTFDIMDTVDFGWRDSMNLPLEELHISQAQCAQIKAFGSEREVQLAYKCI